MDVVIDLQNSGQSYVEDLSNCILKLQSTHNYKIVLLVGDFNLHIDWTLVDRPSSHLGNILFDTCDSVGLEQILQEPSYFTSNGDGHFLDLAFVNNPFIIEKCETIPNVHGCDHLAVSITCNISSQRAKKNIQGSIYFETVLFGSI